MRGLVFVASMTRRCGDIWRRAARSGLVSPRRLSRRSNLQRLVTPGRKNRRYPTKDVTAPTATGEFGKTDFSTHYEHTETYRNMHVFCKFGGSVCHALRLQLARTALSSFCNAIGAVKLTCYTCLQLCFLLFCLLKCIPAPGAQLQSVDLPQRPRFLGYWSGNLQGSMA